MTRTEMKMNRVPEILQRAAAGHLGVELVYASHARWPLLHRGIEKFQIAVSEPHALTVSVLDSSFNPPTKAHMALACLSPAPASDGPPPTGAKLLLLSLENADKVLKPGDATYAQRLEMMVLLAREVENARSGREDNLAVAVCQEPTFVGKAKVLRAFLRDRLAALSASSPSHPTIRLDFLLGFDTLERLFAARYYASETAMRDALHTFFSPDGENSGVICARRSAGTSYSRVDPAVLDVAHQFIQSRAITFADIPEPEQSLSSSEVRNDISHAVPGWERKVANSIAQYLKDNHLYIFLK